MSIPLLLLLHETAERDSKNLKQGSGALSQPVLFTKDKHTHTKPPRSPQATSSVSAVEAIILLSTSIQSVAMLSKSAGQAGATKTQAGVTSVCLQASWRWRNPGEPWRAMYTKCTIIIFDSSVDV